MRQALAIGEKSLGPEHLIVATRLNKLALLLQATIRLSEAELLMRRALAIGREELRRRECKRRRRLQQSGAAAGERQPSQ